MQDWIKRWMLPLAATIFVLGLIAPPSLGISLSEAQLRSYFQDEDAYTAADDYFLVIGGSDGTNYQPFLVDSGGRLQVDVISGGATVAEDFTIGDNAANPSDVQPVAAFPMLYDGTNFDMLRGDGSGNLNVTLATGLNATDDSVSIEIGDVVPQMDQTDRIAVSLYGKNAAAGDTALNVDGDGDVMVETEAGTSLSGHGLIGANSPVRLAVTGTSGCASAVTNNTHYVLKVEAGTDTTIHCCTVSASTCTADQNDEPFFSEVPEKLYVTTNDIFCCVTGNAGTATLTLNPRTYQ